MSPHTRWAALGVLLLLLAGAGGWLLREGGPSSAPGAETSGGEGEARLAPGRRDAPSRERDRSDGTREKTHDGGMIGPGPDDAEIELVYAADGRPLSGSALVMDLDTGDPVARAQVVDGRGTLRGLSRGRLYRLVITPAGEDVLPAERPSWAAGPTRIELGRAQAVSGRVIDQQGLPLGGAVIEYRARVGYVGVRTDESGKFRIGHLKPGVPVRLRANIMNVAHSEELAVFPGEEHLTITLDVGSRLRIRVHGSELPEMKVAFLFPAEGKTTHPIRERALSADGRAEFLGLVAGARYGVWVPSRTGRTVVYEIALYPDDAEQDVSAMPAGTIQGEIEAESVAGLQVLASGLGLEAKGTIREDGYFEIPGLPPGRWQVEVFGSPNRVFSAARTGDYLHFRLER